MNKKLKNKIEKLLENNAMVNDFIQVVGLLHYKSLVKNYTISTDKRAKVLTKILSFELEKHFRKKLSPLRRNREWCKNLSPQKSLIQKLNRRFRIYWSGNNFDYVKISESREPYKEWIPSESYFKNGSWRSNHAKLKIFIPWGYSLKSLNGVDTIIPYRYAKQTSGIIRAYWSVKSRGVDRKIIKGLYCHDTGIHAESSQKLKRMIRKKLRVQKMNNLSDSELLELALKCKKVVNLHHASKRAGNCLAGTEGWLGSLNIKRKKGSVRAITRLAITKGKINQEFRNALKLNLICN